jgi:IPT/TIG domain
VKKGLPALCLGLTAWLLNPPAEAKAKPEFENQYLKIGLSPGWTMAASGDQVLNLIRGKYILSIDPMFTHASGIIGGRFSEFASGKQSIEAVMGNVDQPAGGFECAAMPADAIVVNESLSLANLYTDSSKVGNGCVFPSSGRPVWFGSVFSGPGSESDYAITLTYSSSEVNALPSKDSLELRRVFGEVREMLETLQLKPPIIISKIDPESSSPGARVTIYGSGFNLFNHGAEVRFKEFPNNPMSAPVIAADGNSLTFEVPTSINTISCPRGRIDVNEWCVPTPPNHVDVDDCPSKPDGSTNFCGKPMPPGSFPRQMAS